MSEDTNKPVAGDRPGDVQGRDGNPGTVTVPPAQTVFRIASRVRRAPRK